MTSLSTSNSAGSGGDAAVGARKDDVSPKLFAGSIAVLLLSCIAQFMLVMDDTIVNIALPSISADLKISGATLSWIPNAYLMAFGGFLLIGGRAADMYGRRRVFTISMGVFVAASALCGLAASSEMLVVSRGLAGLAGAFLSPAALSILLATFTAERERTSALATWTALSVIGAVSGLLISGVLTELLDWRWIFLINLPVGLISILAVRRMIPADGDVTGGSPGATSAVAATTALLILVYTIVETERHGWGSTHTAAGLALAAVLAVVFMFRERSSASPLVPASVARRPHIVIANAYMFVAAGVLFSFFFFLTLYMQLVLAYSAIGSGLAYLPFSITLGVTSVLTGRLLTRFSALPFLAIGPVVASAGLFLISRLDAGSAYLSDLVPAIMLTAAGFGVAFVPLLGIATAGVPERDSGIASGLVTSSQQIGGATGIAILVTVATSVAEDRLAAGLDRVNAIAEGFSAAFQLQIGALAVAFVLSGLLSIYGREHARIEGQPVMA